MVEAALPQTLRVHRHFGDDLRARGADRRIGAQHVLSHRPGQPVDAAVLQVAHHTARRAAIAIGRCGAVEPAVGKRAEPALGERPGAVLAEPVAAGKARGGIAAHAERALRIQPVGEQGDRMAGVHGHPPPCGAWGRACDVHGLRRRFLA